MLQAFGSLSIPPANLEGPNFSNDEPLTFDPILVGSGHYEAAAELSRELGGNWYPIGEWLGYSSVFTDVDGHMVATGLGWIWELGRTAEEAIDQAIFARRSLVCLKTLTPGASAWP